MLFGFVLLRARFCKEHGEGGGEINTRVDELREELREAERVIRGQRAPSWQLGPSLPPYRCGRKHRVRTTAGDGTERDRMGDSPPGSGPHPAPYAPGGAAALRATAASAGGVGRAEPRPERGVGA